MGRFRPRYWTREYDLLHLLIPAAIVVLGLIALLRGGGPSPTPTATPTREQAQVSAAATAATTTEQVAATEAAGAPATSEAAAPVVVIASVIGPQPGVAGPANLGAITGVAPPTSTIKIFDGDTPIGEAVADAEGIWTFPLPVLSPGQHALTARVTGADGTETVSPPLSVDVATTEEGAGTPVAAATAAPATPVVIELGTTPNVTLTENTPGEITGSATPSSTVQLFDGDKPVAEVIADAEGKWKVGLPLLLPQLVAGLHELIAKATHPDGTVAELGKLAILVEAAKAPTAATVTPAAAMTAPVATTTTEAAPLVPLVPLTATVTVTGEVPAVATPAETPAAGVTAVVTATAQAEISGAPAAITPTVEVTSTTTLTQGKLGNISGVAAPNSQVQIFDSEDLIGEVTADAEGKWTFPLPELSTGEHALVAVGTGADGKEQELLKLDVIVVPPQAEAPAQAAAVANVTIGATTGPTLTEGNLGDITGTALPNSAVRIFDGDKLLGEVVADADGKWTFPLPELSAGLHSLVAIPAYAGMTGADGKEVVSPKLDVVVERAQAAVAPIEVISATGNVTVTDTDLAGAFAPSSTVQVFDGDKLIGELIADSNGQWSLTLTDLSAGLHTLVARVIPAHAGTAAGQEVERAILNVLVATAIEEAAAPGALPAPAITSAADGSVVAADQLIELSGIAAPDSLVNIYRGRRLIGKTQADASGKWTLPLHAPLPTGLNRLFIIEGIPNTKSAVRSDVISVLVTKKPTIAPPPRGRAFVGLTVLRGTSTPGTQLAILVDDREVGRTTAPRNGRWRFRLPRDVGTGSKTVRVAVIDSVGKLIVGSESLPVRLISLRR